jgi:hypothetical protein
MLYLKSVQGKKKGKQLMKRRMLLFFSGWSFSLIFWIMLQPIKEIDTLLDA